MKLIIYSLLTIILLLGAGIVVLWILGGKEFPLEAETKIKAEPEKIYPYLTEPEKLKLWLSGFAESKPLDDKGLRVGAKAVEVIREENGHTTEFLSEVTKFTANREIELKMTSNVLDATVYYSLEKSGEETLLKHSFRGQFKGFLRLMMPFVGGMAQEKTNNDLQKLKELVEKS